jgi:hypothetical protein
MKLRSTEPSLSDGASYRATPRLSSTSICSDSSLRRAPRSTREILPAAGATSLTLGRLAQQLEAEATVIGSQQRYGGYCFGFEINRPHHVYSQANNTCQQILKSDTLIFMIHVS